MGDESRPEKAQELFDEFVSASTCRAALLSFRQLCEHLDLDPDPGPDADSADARAVPDLGLPPATGQCAVIGAGPCGLRAAVELSFLGARVVVLEKRDAFSRNNVLHLWPFAIHDLRGLGAKNERAGIRQLQLVLLKVALLLGVQVHVNVEFKRVLEPPLDQRLRKVGWTLEAWPKSHLVNRLQFDVIVGADGRGNALPGFRRKEFRGKLAIAITANFKNRNTRAEAKVEEISGVASIFNQQFFQDLRRQTGLCGQRAAPLSGQRGPAGVAGLRPRGRRLLHQGPAAVPGLCHQPPRPARRGRV
uniref:SVOP-like n=1 Tax=Hippocampus comes TaxID=109280 RepID=A0A3Q2XKZ1_HIPCM